MQIPVLYKKKSVIQKTFFYKKWQRNFYLSSGSSSRTAGITVNIQLCMPSVDHVKIIIKFTIADRLFEYTKWCVKFRFSFTRSLTSQNLSKFCCYRHAF